VYTLVKIKIKIYAPVAGMEILILIVSNKWILSKLDQHFLHQPPMGGAEIYI